MEIQHNTNPNGKISYISSILLEKKNKKEQAGTELCQAQVKLGLVEC